MSRPLACRQPHRRVRVRLWIPLLLVLVLLSPILLLTAMIAAVVLLAMGLSPIRVFAALGRVLLALRGTHVEVEAPAASVIIRIV